MEDIVLVEVHAAQPSHGWELVCRCRRTDRLELYSVESVCKPGFQKAMVDESVDCAVECFHAGRFITRTS